MEGRRGQERKNEKDLKIDLAVKGDIQRLAGLLLLPDNEPSSQANGYFFKLNTSSLETSPGVGAPP